MWTRFISAALCVSLAGCQLMPFNAPASQPDGLVQAAPVVKEEVATDDTAPIEDSLGNAHVYEMPMVSERVQTQYDEALAQLRAGDLQAAERALLKLTKRHGDLAGPWLNLARVYVMSDRLDDAEAAYGSALEANPLNCAAYTQFGVMLRKQGRFAEAEEAYASCLSVDPNFTDAYLNLGILYELYLGRLPEALAAYRQYHALSDTEERRVRGWIMDLERRLGV